MTFNATFCVSLLYSNFTNWFSHHKNTSQIIHDECLRPRACGNAGSSCCCQSVLNIKVMIPTQASMNGKEKLNVHFHRPLIISNIPDPDLHIAERGRLPLFHHFGNFETQTVVKLLMITISMLVGLQRVVVDFASTRFREYKWSIFYVGSVTKRCPDAGFKAFFFVVAAMI